MEHGFYHPDRGYWQAIGGDVAELLAMYPSGTIEVPLKPGSDYDWLDGEWVYAAPVSVVPERVTANQFGQQMIVSGIKAQVDAWIAGQSEAVQWAYARSSTFVRADPMMQSGFETLGFQPAQIDQFFIDAAKIGVD
jgi:hypothetical protein